jgi:putative glutamine amidotransferase
MTSWREDKLDVDRVERMTVPELHERWERLGDGLQVTGWAVLDDLPEAVEAPDKRFALGVQWHPEADELSAVIESFVREAARTAVP